MCLDYESLIFIGYDRLQSALKSVSPKAYIGQTKPPV